MAGFLFGFGVVTFTVGVMLAIVFYRKHKRGRKIHANIEEGLNRRLDQIRARTGPRGIRLKTAR